MWNQELNFLLTKMGIFVQEAMSPDWSNQKGQQTINEGLLGNVCDEVSHIYLPEQNEYEVHDMELVVEE